MCFPETLLYWQVLLELNLWWLLLASILPIFLNWWLPLFFYFLHLLISFIHSEVSTIFYTFQPVSCLRTAWLRCLCLELSGCYSSLTKSDYPPFSLFLLFFFSFYTWRVETVCEFIIWLYKINSLDLIYMPRYSLARILVVCCPFGRATLSVQV